MTALYLVLGIVVVAILVACWNFVGVKRLEEGTAEMSRKAAIIRSGARTFTRTEYGRILVVAIIVALIISLFMEKTAGLTFLIGAALSSIACILGMEDSYYANVRTTNRARETIHLGKGEALARTMDVALKGGSVPGLSVMGFGILGLLLVWFLFGGIKLEDPGSGLIMTIGSINASAQRFTTYSLGASIVAMFSRVAGGNYTKAADISSDIVGKNRYGLDEDDARIPNVIADFIGDNVNDIAGNCSDLLESFVATIVATMLIAISMFNHAKSNGLALATEGLLNASTLYPIMIAGGGLLSCVVGLLVVQLRKNRKAPQAELNLATYLSAGLAIVISGIISLVNFGGIELYAEFKLGWASPWVATILGILCGVFIGQITEYFTSTKYKPTQKLASFAPEGEAFVATFGDAIGSQSILPAVLILVIAIIGAGKIAGNYGLAMAALGMLSFVATTVAIDAFGPIADNAGGLAEACGLDEKVREVTDELDAVGNTTAAIGKGFAIGSAALATMSLINSFVETYTPTGTATDLNFAEFMVVSGAMLGMALVEFFVYILTKNTIEAAKIMADDGDKMLKAELETGVEPDYDRCIKTATEEALRRMVKPSIIALLVPVICGVLFGPKFVGGVLIGATIIAIGRAIFMGNSGGAFDNAKKYIEQGLLPGHKKGDAAHKAAVTGDTIGDTRKDVVGVALDIFIKIMSTVAITFAPLFIAFTLF